jgi:AraC-like DNA-binding protein
MDDQVSFRSVAQWLRATSNCGIDLVELLREAGVVDQLAHPDNATISRDVLRQLMRQCIDMALKGNPPRYFPVELAREARFEYLSDLEVVMSTAGTFRDLLPILDLFPSFYDPTIRVSVAEFGAEARFEMSHIRAGDCDELGGPFVEQFFLAIGLACHRLLDDPHVVARVTFRHKAHAGSAELAGAFPVAVPISYEKELNACWFDRRLLDRPLRSFIPSLHRAAFDRLAASARESIQKAPDLIPSGIEGRLERLLAQRPELLGKKQSDVADEMGLHARALQRKLQVENTTYADVVSRVRDRIALRHLECSEFSVAEIAKMLGYSARSGFAEAFTRQHGISPSAYRESKKSPAGS